MKIMTRDEFIYSLFLLVVLLFIVYISYKAQLEDNEPTGLIDRNEQLNRIENKLDIKHPK